MFLGAGLSACTGGGSEIARIVAANPSASPGAAAPATAYGTIRIVVPPKASAASRTRKPSYISAGTTSAALFIDGATTPAGMTTTCSATVSSGAGCTITWTTAVSVPAAHSFAVEIDNGTTVLAENKASYAIVSGSNTLAVLTLNGIAASATLTGETCATTNCSGTLTFSDAAGDSIVNTTSPLAAGFDNGPLTLASTATSVGSVTAGATQTQPSATGTAAYTVTCDSSAGSFSTTLSPASTTGSGDITGAELSGRGLVYPASISSASDHYFCTTGTTISDQAIYVGEYTEYGSVLVYPLRASGAATPFATIGGGSTGIQGPLGVVLDTAGRIYVANYNANSLTVYAANPVGSVTTAPVAKIAGANTALSEPFGLVMDGNGRTIVTNFASSTVTVYAANPVGTLNEIPVATISGSSTGLSGPQDVALDSTGRIYVSNEASDTVTVYAANPSGSVTSAPLATISGVNPDFNDPAGMAFDSSGRLYVANYGNADVLVFAANANGNATPVATIGGGSTALDGPASVALDSTGRIYVGNELNGTVTEYAASPVGSVTSAPLTTISTGTAGFGQALAIH